MTPSKATLTKRPATRRASGARPGTLSSEAFVPPYPPSWIDQLTAKIDRLPGATWMFYATVGGTYTLLFLLAQARLGANDALHFLSRVFLALQPLYFLAVIHWLDRVAQDAARRYFASRPEARGAAQANSYRLTTLPRWPTLIACASALLAVLYFLFTGGAQQVGSLGLATGPAGVALVAVHFGVMWILLGALIYHTFHQLRTVHQIYAAHPVADIYAPEPYYAFTGLALQTALLITLNNYGWIVADPATLRDPFSLGLTVFLAGLALLMFVWPLWGAHQMLAASKADALAVNSARFKAVVAELHLRLEVHRITGMDELNKSLASLEIERTALARIPTWPWQPGTLRGLVATLGLPIAVWLIQYLLGRALS